MNKNNLNKNMLKKSLLSLFIITSAFVAGASAQTETSADKKAVIREINSLINAENDAEKMFAILASQSDSMRETIVDSILNERADLSDAEKKFVRQSVIEQLKKNEDRFREKLMQKLNFNEIVEEVSIAIYDKYYTLEELRDLLAFYKSPTGQKMLKIMTPLLTDTVQMTQERMIPKLGAVLKEIEAEEKQVIEKEVEARKPRPKKPVSK